jgi:hypothetical protein
MMSSRSRDVILFLVERRVSIVLLLIEFVVHMLSDEVVIILNDDFKNDVSFDLSDFVKCSLKVDELNVLIREFRRNKRSDKMMTLFMIFS